MLDVMVVLGAALAVIGTIFWALGGKGELIGKAAAADASLAAANKRLREALDQETDLRKKLSQAELERNTAETRIKEVEKSLADQRALVEKAKADLKEAFNGLAASALTENNRKFLELASHEFVALKDNASSELQGRQEAIEDVVRPLRETLDHYQDETRKLKELQLSETGSLRQQLEKLVSVETKLQIETASLVSALRSPTVKGDWGQMTLRRIAELAGMSVHCDFCEQQSVSAEEGRYRPDMVVKLPGNREIVVDSKASTAWYQRAMESATEPERRDALDRYADQIQKHVNDLSSKQYWDQFPASLDFVVMFLPNDNFLAAAAERRRDLIEDALSKRIVIATPATLIALLRAVAYGWGQATIDEKAKEVYELVHELL